VATVSQAPGNTRRESLDSNTIRALNAINRRFYRDRAREFSQTRDAPWPGWTRLMESLGDGTASAPLHVLDVGCGNGRFARFLRERGRAFRYLGVDASAALLDHARARLADSPDIEFAQTDFVETSLDGLRAEKDFSLIVLFGVLHHVPGRERRVSLLQSLARRLTPDGRLAATAWQFQAFQRFRDRLLPWDRFNRESDDPIDTSQLETGDHLLPWGPSPGAAVRFCHFSDETEMQALVSDAGLACLKTWLADGREGDLNRYYLLRRGA
jgi:SAM-dependent methyltransferase